jgi:DNA repair protein RadC
MKQLSDAALLGLLIGDNAAANLLQGGIEALLAPMAAEFTKSLEVRDVEAIYASGNPLAKIAAAIELSGRFMAAQLRELPAFKNPELVSSFVKTQLRFVEYEVFLVLYLDSQNCLIESRELFRGTTNQTSVYPPEVVKTALQLNASALILVHNHPSGCCEPSRADQMLTTALKTACSTVDMQVLDHLIVAGETTYSFASHGML